MSDMTKESASFEDTLDVLEQQRDAIERSFNDQIEALQRVIGDLEGQLAGVKLEESREIEGLPALQSVLGDLEAYIGEGEPPIEAWAMDVPAPRRWLDRALGWALRDSTRVIKNGQKERQSIHALVLVALRCLSEQNVATHVTLQHEALKLERWACALHRALCSAVESFSLVLQIQRSQLALMNAKDAETLQRAVHGPLRAMEVMFEEFRRQQEALISGLVGRRQELDLLVERAAGALTPSATKVEKSD